MAGDCAGRGERPGEPAGAPCRCFNALWLSETDCALDGLSLAAWPHPRGWLEAAVGGFALAFLLCALHFGVRLHRSLRLQRAERAPQSQAQPRPQAPRLLQARVAQRLDARVWLNGLGLAACLIKSVSLCCGSWSLGLLFFEGCSRDASFALSFADQLLLASAHQIACFVQLDLLLALDNPFRRRLDPVKAVLVYITFLCVVGVVPTVIAHDSEIFSIVFIAACASNLVFVYVYSKALAMALSRIANLNTGDLQRALHVDKVAIRRIKLYRAIMIPTLLLAILVQLLDFFVSFDTPHSRWLYAFLNWTVASCVLQFLSIMAIFLSTQRVNNKHGVVVPSKRLLDKGGSDSAPVITQERSAARNQGLLDHGGSAPVLTEGLGAAH